MIAASFSFACGSILTKMLGNSFFGEGVHPLQIAHSRFFFGFIILLFFYIYLKPSLKSLYINLHILRSLFGVLGVSIWFTSLLYIPASDATAINFLNPIFAMIFAIFFLSEKVGWVRWLATIISLFGGLLLIRPSTDLNVNPIALLCLFGALIMGMEIICIKYLSEREAVFKILLLNNFFAFFIASFWLPFFFKIPGLLEIFCLVAVAICFITGQFFFINSMKRAEASFIMPFFYTTLIFVILLDLIFFNFFPDKISFVGAFLIIFGTLVVTIRENKIRS